MFENPGTIWDLPVFSFPCTNELLKLKWRYFNINLILKLLFFSYTPSGKLSHKWENAMTLDKRSWGNRRNADIADFLTKKVYKTRCQLAVTRQWGLNDDTMPSGHYLHLFNSMYIYTIALICPSKQLHEHNFANFSLSQSHFLFAP